MKGNFLLGVGVGILAAYLWKQMSKKAGKQPEKLTIEEAVTLAQDVVKDESNKFGSALKKEYDIVMPSDQVSKKVRMRSKELTEGRYAVKVDNIQKPVSL